MVEICNLWTAKSEPDTLTAVGLPQSVVEFGRFYYLFIYDQCYLLPDEGLITN